jgi:murein DD-endopeptidase MepM/ murein hydrolase activator NlpD
LKRNGEITVIVTRLSGAAARKLTIPRKLLVASLVALAVFASCAIFSSLHYYYMWNQSKAFSSLEAELMTLRKQNEAFKMSARQLTDRVSSIEVSAQKLRIAAGYEESDLGGVGGPPADKDIVLALDETSLYDHFKSLDRKSLSLQTELRKLQEYYKDRGILMAATPAVMPVRGYPSDHYGYRSDPFTGKREFHPGIDLSAPHGNKVIATADGVVRFAGRQVGYGRMVKIQHRFGISTRYGHLARTTVKKGQEVKKGDVIGVVGATGRATGPHVHYEVRLNGRPLDPARFFRESN